MAIIDLYKKSGELLYEGWFELNPEFVSEDESFYNTLIQPRKVIDENTLRTIKQVLEAINHLSDEFYLSKKELNENFSISLLDDSKEFTFNHDYQILKKRERPTDEKDYRTWEARIPNVKISEVNDWETEFTNRTLFRILFIIGEKSIILSNGMKTLPKYVVGVTS